MDKFFSSLPTYKFSNEEINWISIDQRSSFTNQEIDRFSILTYNVLFSTFEKSKEQSNARVQKLIELLKYSNADIIGLQEVTQSFLIQLLREDWVKNKYYVSDSIQGTTVNPYGQLLLSKFPFKLITLKYVIFLNYLIILTKL
ncbi:endonuclease/exonuclease/phosphatase family protein [Brasilonema sp. CT11]|nr:endonuclease/exonuclease/phosphatase family protein [Brasilonema sp. CT11]